MRKILLTLTFLFATLGAFGEELFYPEGETLLVAHVKSVDKLVVAFDKFKAWFQANPELMDFWAPVTEGVLDFDLRGALTDMLAASPQEFNKCFSGAATLIVDESAEAITRGDYPGFTVVVEPPSEEGARQLEASITQSDRVDSLRKEEGDVDCTRIVLKKETDGKKSYAGMAQIFVLRQGSRVWLSTSADSLGRCVKAQTAAFSPDFFRKANEADLALWLDPKPVVALIQKIIEEKAAEANQASSSAFNPELIEKLGINSASGIGVSADLTAMELRVELASEPSAGGVFELLNCVPSGLDPTPLLPAAADEFVLGRFDMDCLWRTLKELLKQIVPATETIYGGWQKQILETYGVDVDRQLFGAVGTHYINYTLSDEQGGRSSVTFIELRDCVAFKQAIDAVVGFFSQGKEYFTHETIAGTTVYRLDGKFQEDSSASFSYAITPKWLIVCVGGPSEMANVVESLSSDSLSPVWKTPAVRPVNDREVPLVCFGYRSMQSFWEELALGALEWDAQSSEKNKTQPAWSADEVPDFSSVVGSVTSRMYIQPGLFTTLLKFHAEK